MAKSASPKGQRVQEVMTPSPATCPATAPVSEAARTMRDRDIGSVIVLESERLYGILTDRDIVVRGVADGRDPASTPVADLCSRELSSVTAQDRVDDAIRLMREKALRRLPVMDDGRIIGILSLGDLAVRRDRQSALGGISAAPPNR